LFRAKLILMLAEGSSFNAISEDLQNSAQPSSVMGVLEDKLMLRDRQQGRSWDIPVSRWTPSARACTGGNAGISSELAVVRGISAVQLPRPL
jgi:hypothetical protein